MDQGIKALGKRVDFDQLVDQKVNSCPKSIVDQSQPGVRN